MTLTVPHVATDDLQPLLDVVARAWRKMLAGKAWKTAQRALGVEGYVRAIEISWGSNGPHPHVHAIVLTRYELPARLTDDELRALPAPVLERVARLRRERDDRRLADWRSAADELDALDKAAVAATARGGRGMSSAPRSVEGLRVWMWLRWARIVKRLGLAASPSLANGVRVDGATHAARYLAKFGLAQEITASAAKRGRSRNMTHWQLLRRCDGGRPYDRARWQEHVEATKGRRQLTWSRGLRVKLGLGEEAPDEAIARAAAEVERRVTVEGRTFDARLRFKPHKVRDLELAVEAADMATIADILGPAHGWAFSLPGDDVVLGGQETRIAAAQSVHERHDDDLIPIADYDPVTGEVRNEHIAAYARSVLRKERRWMPSRSDKRRELELRALVDKLPKREAPAD